MCFTRKDELDGTILVVDNVRQPFQIAEDKRSPFVRRETPGEADGERFRIKHFIRARDFRRRCAPILELDFEPGPSEADESFSPALMGPPEFRIRYVIGPLPDAVIGRVLLQLSAQITIIKLEHIRRDPTARMHAVGYGDNRNLALRQFGPDITPHLARYAAVEFTDAVAAVGQADGQNRHAELLAQS